MFVIVAVAEIERARKAVKTAFLDRCLAERDRRVRAGQRAVLEQFDDDVVLAYAADRRTGEQSDETT